MNPCTTPVPKEKAVVCGAAVATERRHVDDVSLDAGQGFARPGRIRADEPSKESLGLAARNAHRVRDGVHRPPRRSATWGMAPPS